MAKQLTPQEALAFIQQLHDRWSQGGQQDNPFSLGGSDNSDGPEKFVEAVSRADDPIGYANKMAALPSNAFGSTNAFAPGQLFDQNRAKLTAHPVLAATSGNTAENQLRALEDPTFAKTMAMVASKRIPVDRGVVTNISPSATFLPPVTPLLPGTMQTGRSRVTRDNPLGMWSAMGSTLVKPALAWPKGRPAR